MKLDKNKSSKDACLPTIFPDASTTVLSKALNKGMESEEFEIDDSIKPFRVTFAVIPLFHLNYYKIKTWFVNKSVLVIVTLEVELEDPS